MRLSGCEAELHDLTVSFSTPCFYGTTGTAQQFAETVARNLRCFLQLAQGERPLPTLDVLLP